MIVLKFACFVGKMRLPPLQILLLFLCDAIAQSEKIDARMVTLRHLFAEQSGVLSIEEFEDLAGKAQLFLGIQAVNLSVLLNRKLCDSREFVLAVLAPSCLVCWVECSFFASTKDC